MTMTVGVGDLLNVIRQMHRLQTIQASLYDHSQFEGDVLGSSDCLAFLYVLVYHVCVLPPAYVVGVAQLVRTSVYDRQTFPALCHDMQLTGDLVVNCPLYVKQHGQLSHSSSCG